MTAAKGIHAFRLDDLTLEKLQQHADKLQVNRSDLVRYYLDVALNIRRDDPVTFYLDSLLRDEHPTTRKRRKQAAKKAAKRAPRRKAAR